MRKQPSVYLDFYFFYTFHALPFLHACEQHTHPPSRRFCAYLQTRPSFSSSCSPHMRSLPPLISHLSEVSLVISRSIFFSRFTPSRETAEIASRQFCSQPTLDSLSTPLRLPSSSTQLAQESRNIYVVG